MKLNKQYFSKEQIEKKEHVKLLDYLMSEAYGAGEEFNDIHIVPADEGSFIIEWSQQFWNKDYRDGQFVFIESGETIMKEYRLPDNTYMYFETEDEYNEYLEDWLKENPGWEKTQYGTWTNRIENEKFLADLKKAESKKMEDK